LHGSTSPPPPLPSASPHLNFRGLVFNFKFKVSVALSFFLLRIFFSRTKSFIDIEDKQYEMLNVIILCQTISDHSKQMIGSIN
jgi:hypothetical protein